MKNLTPIKSWTAEERINAVNWMFNNITRNYDLLNHLMSAGQDIIWRKVCVSKFPSRIKASLDIATGTGDLAFEIAKKFPAARVVGLDFAEKMIEVAQNKKHKRQSSKNVRFMVGDAMNLPYPENSFDVSTIAFGLRNIPDRLGALSEMRRVIRPGGKVMVLEMTLPRNPNISWFFNFYLDKIMPAVGGIISGNRQAYRYLPESIEDFLTPSQLSEQFIKAGMHGVSYYPLFMGIAYLHVGIV